MKLQMIHPSPSASTKKTIRSKNVSTCDGKAPASSSSLHDLREWIQQSIVFEQKCLEDLSTPSNGKTASAEDSVDETFASKTSAGRNNKENIHGQLEICLPLVDWKAAFAKAHKAAELQKAASKIVQRWLLVLEKLHDVAPSSVASFRSQIYGRLTLLLVGFVSTTTSGGDSCLSNQEQASMVVVKHTLYLARKILKEEGSHMKNTKADLSAASSRRNPTGVYHYCFFTAIAAECCEALGDLDRALLAYKSIRAMQDRQPGACSVYNHKMLSTSTSSPTPANTPTKTPANTPQALVRKKPAISDIGGSSSNPAANHRRSLLFSPRAVMHVGFQRNDNHHSNSSSSKIGNDLVLPGSLGDRILRCSLQKQNTNESI